VLPDGPESTEARYELYKKKAAKLRALALQASSDDSRAEFTRLAALYERMAEDLPQRHRPVAMGDSRSSSSST
jgi:hypothetical protein